MAKDPSDSRRAALCDWLTANGINPSTIPVDADLTIDTHPDNSRHIAYEAFVLNQDGNIMVDERGTGPAIEKRTTPLLLDPPTLWEPYQKPTRDDLLASTNRVRTLHRCNEHTGDCEYCSQRDYPDYCVPWPCDTIQALDGGGVQP